MKDWLKQNTIGILILVGVVSLIVIVLFQKPVNNNAFYESELKRARDSSKLYQPTIDSLLKVVNTKDKDYTHSDSLVHANIEATNKILYELRKQKESINTDTLSSANLVRYFSTLTR